MRVQGTFKGEKPSMGFKPGKTYIFDVKGNWIYKRPTDNFKSTPYASLESFLANWGDVNTITEGAVVEMGQS